MTYGLPLASEDSERVTVRQWFHPSPRGSAKKPAWCQRSAIASNEGGGFGVGGRMEEWHWE